MKIVNGENFISYVRKEVVFLYWCCNFVEKECIVKVVLVVWVLSNLEYVIKVFYFNDFYVR